MTSPVPVAAAASIVMFAVTVVLLTKTVEFTVIPAPENETLAPLTKRDPVIVTVWLVAPCGRELGLTDVTADPRFTVNTPIPTPTPVSGFITVTLRAPVAAPEAIVMFATSDALLTNAVEFTVIPEPENDAPAPVTNPEPVIVTFWLLAP